nr:Dihydrofolate reductase [uncultured bacterium]
MSLAIKVGSPGLFKGEQKRLKEITLGSPLIMGRKTHESVGRTLPGRLNIVISRNPKYTVNEGSVLVSSLEKALSLDKVKSAKQAFIFGGEKIFAESMPLLKRIYLTRVHTTLEGDSFFRYNPKEWKIISEEKHKKDLSLGRPYDFDYIVLERKQS